MVGRNRVEVAVDKDNLREENTLCERVGLGFQGELICVFLCFLRKPFLTLLDAFCHICILLDPLILLMCKVRDRGLNKHGYIHDTLNRKGRLLKLGTT